LCTVFAEVPFAGTRPMLIAAIRDEVVSRPSLPPGYHWAGEYGGILGGLDVVAGGTWLAVHPARGAASFVLNLPGPAPHRALSRGGLPLRALAHHDWWEGLNLDRHAGFILGRATCSGLDVWTWDGRALDHERPAPGLHGLCHTGLDSTHPRLSRHLPGFRAAVPSDPLGPLPANEAWAGWSDLLSGGGIAPDDPAALLWARSIGGENWGSRSAACVALARDGVRYDFTLDPMHPGCWRTVCRHRYPVTAR
jgi:uncharacterized protein with NRDE domain